MMKIIVPGEPVPQGRPRFSTKNGFKGAFDPEKSRAYKEQVRIIAKAKNPVTAMAGAVRMTVDIYRTIPRSWPKKKQLLAEEGKLLPTNRPDVDNYAKAIKDALSGVVYEDDSQVVRLTVSKQYGREPRAEIEVEEIITDAGEE
jgi:Holliday junction resolvase RusA-like endonuclease